MNLQTLEEAEKTLQRVWKVYTDEIGPTLDNDMLKEEIIADFFGNLFTADIGSVLLANAIRDTASSLRRI